MGAQTKTALMVWERGAANAAYLVASLLKNDGAQDIDQQHPQGGPDEGKDILCVYKNLPCVVAVWFPNNSVSKTFANTRTKFRDDLVGASKVGRPGFIFATNKGITAGERAELEKLALEAGFASCFIYHLERLHSLLDEPRGFAAREQYLEIPLTNAELVSFHAAENLANREFLEKTIAKHLVDHKEQVALAFATQMDKVMAQAVENLRAVVVGGDGGKK